MKAELYKQRYVSVQTPQVSDKFSHIKGVCYLPEKITNSLFVLWLAYSYFFSSNMPLKYEYIVKIHLGLFEEI